jgi:proteasome lid subunit RPN8/RPN11
MSSLDVRAIDEAGLRAAPCPAARCEYRVFLSEQAFDRAVERGATDTTREIGGVLVGELLRDQAGPYLLIETTIDALHAEEKGAELTFTHATWEHIHKEMDSRHPGKRVVGWYHTHPGFGVFLSDRDQFIHKSFFDLPFQVALVYDPKAKEHGLFLWRDDEVVRARRYWIGAREQVWDGARTHGKPAERPRDEQSREGGARPRDASAEPDLRGEERGAPPSLVAAATAVLLILAAGFAGHWLGTCSARGALVQAQLDVAKARTDGAQLAIESLESDLVGILRQTLSAESVRRPIGRAIDEIDRAIAALRAAGPPAAATEQAIAQAGRAREELTRLRDDRGAAAAVLEQLELAARRGGGARTDLARDVAEQRSGLGTLYAELAADAARAGDRVRARRLLAAAAHLDPGNRARYEKQLQTFDRSGVLQREIEPLTPEGRR